MNEQMAKEFVSFARRVAEEEAAWADWHNIVFGVEGEFVKRFPKEADRETFFDSAYHVEVQAIEQALREGKTIAEYTLPVTTASGKFVIRLPKSLHRALVIEAKDEGVSLNQLIMSKLSISLKRLVDAKSVNSSQIILNEEVGCSAK